MADHTLENVASKAARNTVRESHKAVPSGAARNTLRGSPSEAARTAPHDPLIAAAHNIVRGLSSVAECNTRGLPHEAAEQRPNHEHTEQVAEACTHEAGDATTAGHSKRADKDTPGLFLRTIR